MKSFVSLVSSFVIWTVLTVSVSLSSLYHQPVEAAGGYMDKTTYNTQGKVQKVRRERNIDYWDSDTLAYYLDDYRGVDVAILFYAQWDGNSRSLAPYWAQMAQRMDAGTSNSNMIMALFDCELNGPHSQICLAAGITHYPTMLFIGSGPYYDTDPLSRAIFGKKAAGKLGEAPIQNTVKFQGQWQYTDSIEDWIRTMQALSHWHTWNTEGFGSKVRSFFFPKGTKKTALPIGVPGGRTVTASTNALGGVAGASSSSSSAATDARVKELEARLKKSQEAAAKLEKVSDRSSNFLDVILTGGNNTQDMFTLLHNQKAWTKSDRPTAEVLRRCVTELSFDYCQRQSQSQADALVDDLFAQGKSVDDILGMDNLEQLIMDRIGVVEPYCMLIDDCVVTDFAGEKCQPQQCPFQNKVACQYLTSCLNTKLQEDFAGALGMELGKEPSISNKTESEQGKKQEQKQKKTWGM